MIHPAATPTANKTRVSKRHQTAVTINFDKTMTCRETGNASISFMVRSEYSLPKIQLVTNPNPISPIMLTICMDRLKYAAQSQFSPKKVALVPSRPSLLISSGFFEINIKSPMKIDIKAKARIVIGNILDLRTLRLSTHKADKIPFILHFLHSLRLFLKNMIPGFPLPLSAILAEDPHILKYLRYSRDVLLHHPLLLPVILPGIHLPKIRFQ